jgi:Protein of unknown function (DUF1749)
MIHHGKSDDIVPRNFWKMVGGAPCSAYRFTSLAAPGVGAPLSICCLTNKGDDDYFSSDLSPERLNEIWGSPAWQNVALMVLYSKEDQYVPNFVDINSLVRRWEATYRSQGFAADGTFEILHHANHELADER